MQTDKTNPSINTFADASFTKSKGRYVFDVPRTIYAKKDGDEIKRLMTSGTLFGSDHNNYYGKPKK